MGILADAFSKLQAGRNKEKDKEKKGEDRQVDRSIEVAYVFVFMFMYLSNLWRWILGGGLYVCAKLLPRPNSS